MMRFLCVLALLMAALVIGVEAEPVVLGTSPFQVKGELRLPDRASLHRMGVAGDGNVVRPLTAIVLLSGSGPHDMDETIGPNKVFRELSDGLARKGVGTLRFDKATYAHGREMKPENFTFAFEYYDDARAAIQLLRNDPRIDPHRIFLLGHSLGASAALKLAATEDVAGIILMAGPARPIQQYIFEQIRFQGRIHGHAVEAERQVALLQESLRQVARGEKKDDEMLFGATAKYWREWMKLDGRLLIRAVRVPVLILHGTKDCQVPVTDVHLFKAAWGRRGGLTIKILDGLNHLFMPVKGRSTGDEYQQAGHLDVRVAAMVRSWIGKQQRPGRSSTNFRRLADDLIREPPRPPLPRVPPVVRSTR